MSRRADREDESSRTIVFVGPTLNATEAQRLLPGATIVPPVSVGDVFALLRTRGLRRLAIIDGYFERMAAVWHKELLLALEQGIEVWGAASMGALRAAELAPFGMRGVGAIYRAFARGAYTADDEVAVAHLPAEAGYRPVSDALVNLRAWIAKAPGLTAPVREQLVALARRRFYRERTAPGLLADARAAGLPARQIAMLAAQAVPDQKAADARLLLRTLGRTPWRRAAKLSVPRTWALRQLGPLPARRRER